MSNQKLDNFPNYTAKKFPEYENYLLTRDKMPPYEAEDPIKDLPDDFDLILKTPYNYRQGTTDTEDADTILHFFSNEQQLRIILERTLQKSIDFVGRYYLLGVFPIQTAAWMTYCLAHNTDSFGDKYDWNVFEILKGELVDFHHNVSGYKLTNLSRWRSDLSVDELDLPSPLYNDPAFSAMWQKLAKDHPMQTGDVEKFDPENHLKK